MRKTPPKVYNGIPCSIVSVGCALGENNKSVIQKAKGLELKNNGYLTLKDMNKYIRSCISIQKYEYYKRTERFTLKELLNNNTKKAIVCLLGHYVYIDSKDYYSFFKNEEDNVVAIWWIKEEKNNERI